MSNRFPRRYALVGLGYRAGHYLAEIFTRYRDHSRIVGFCDVSMVRMKTHERWLAERFAAPSVPCYAAGDFTRMLVEQRPDVLIVASTDATHHHFIVTALDHGCDVITEKPMTTDAEKCRCILEAAVRHPERRISVAFNYRWAPTNAKVRELLASGVIGTVKSVNLEWLLDVRHGADYFRRWHSEKAASGGLLVHKATHHFDLVNWWLGSEPDEVFATGGLMFYGEANAVARGERERTRYDRYTGQPEARQDPFCLDLAQNERFRELYLAAEQETGYIRDRNVFRPGIDIEDNLSVLVRYRSGQMLSYNLNAFSPREGMRVAFNGDRGRLEFYLFDRSNPSRRVNDEGQLDAHEAAPLRHATERSFIRVYPHFAPAYDVAVDLGCGGHWGGDEPMWRHFFAPSPPPDPLGCNAGVREGAASMLVGVAANLSLARRIIVPIANIRPAAMDVIAPASHNLSRVSV